MSEKIQPHHVSRQAYVYVRQSTMNQVRNHLESQRRQYDLEERARPPNGVGTFANAIPLDQFSRHRREHIDDFDVAKS